MKAADIPVPTTPGPLLDELVAAARALRDAPRDGSVDISALHRRLYAALAAFEKPG